jgi:uroporphyrinogen III methyltransferase/synthase
MPLIEVTAPPDGGVAMRSALARLAEFEWLAFSSANGVDAAFAELTDARELHGVRVAAVGAETAAALARHGIVADLVAARGGAAGVLAVFPPPSDGGAVLLARASEGLLELQRGLEELGYRVESVDAYSTRESAPADTSGLRGADGIVFASPSAVRAFVRFVGAAHRPSTVISIGPTTSAALVAAGIGVDQEASTPSTEGIVAAICEGLARP